MVVDEGVADVGEREAPQRGDGVVGSHAPGRHVVEQRPQRRFLHGRHAATLVVCSVMARSSIDDGVGRVGFFGPFGTFAEQAVRSQSDLSAAELVDYPTVPDVFDAVAAGEVDCGVVPMENSIEGVVNFTQDALAFDYDLLIQREIVLDIEHCLVGAPGLTLDQVKAVISIPVATAQCHRFLRQQLRSAEVRESGSTAAAARLVAQGDGTNPPEPGLVAIANRMAAERYGLSVVAANIADHPGNQTRFIVVARDGVPGAPATTGPGWSCSSAPTSQEAWCRSSRSSRRGGSTCRT